MNEGERMEIKAVIFDMDGVLIDSEPSNLKQLSDFYELHGVIAEPSFLISLVGSSIEYTGVESIHLLQKDWSIEEFYERFDGYANQHPVSYRDILNPGVKETLLWLKQHGYRIAIGSSSTLSNIQRMLEECELQDVFDIVFSGEMFAKSKPNPEIYLSIAQHLKLAPCQCMVIEDSSFGIEAGKKAGMMTIALTDHCFGIDQSKADDHIECIQDICDKLQ